LTILDRSFNKEREFERTQLSVPYPAASLLPSWLEVGPIEVETGVSDVTIT
jgi:hypothetical protein